jgi:hypothetical protein
MCGYSHSSLVICPFLDILTMSTLFLAYSLAKWIGMVVFLTSTMVTGVPAAALPASNFRA